MGALVYTPPHLERAARVSAFELLAATAAEQHRALIALLRSAAARLTAEADALEGGLLPAESAATGAAQLAPVARRIDCVRLDLALANTCVGAELILRAVRAAREGDGLRGPSGVEGPGGDAGDAGPAPHGAAPEVSRPERPAALGSRDY